MVRLSPAERADAERKAGIDGCSLSEVTRLALAAYVPGGARNAIRNETSEESGPRVVYDEGQG